MKKLITLLAFVGLVSLQSCTVNDTNDFIDNDTISEVIEVTTSFNSANDFTTIVGFNQSLFPADVVLVYHLYEVVNGQDVWRPMPQTYYIANGGVIDYNFDFTRTDVKIFMGANFDLNTAPSSWTQNQTFRIVIVPARFLGVVDKSNYLAVVNTLNIKESQVQKVNF
jgi:hypothetical protein